MQKLVIASNIGGSNETIIDKKSGFLFDAGNSEDLLEKLTLVLDLDLETGIKIKEEARNNVIKKFDVEKMCFSTYSEYKKVNKLMLNITLPDGNKLNFEKQVTGLEIAEKISKSLSKNALLISVDDKLKDLNTIIDKDCSVKKYLPKDKEGLETIST